MANRILREPSGRQIYSRLQGTQHASVGLVRSKGILGGERVIVTSDEALGEILRQPDLFEIPPQRRLVTGHLLGNGLLAASGETHKVNIPSECASSLSPADVPQVPAQEPRPRLRTCQYSKVLWSVLGKSFRACDAPVKAAQG